MAPKSAKAKTRCKSTTAKTRRKACKAQTSSHCRETIRDILFTKFPRVHSNEEVLASQRTHTFGPPITQLAPVGSKRSRGLTADLSNQEGHPLLYGKLISWQGAMPGYHMMHLAAHLRMRKVIFVGNLSNLFADSIPQLGGLDVEIPPGDDFSSADREQRLSAYEKTTGPNHAVETVAHLTEAQMYREELVAACSSAAIASPTHFADSVGLLAWKRDPPTLQPGSEEVKATGYILLNPRLPGVSDSTKRAHKLAYDAIKHFELSAIQATRVQPICAPLNQAFPLSAAVRAAKLETPLESFMCQGPDDPAHFCHSIHCRGKVAEIPYPFTTAGRPTGVDGDLVSELISRAAKSNVPVEPPNKEELVTSSLLLDQAWGVLVGTDSTVGTITGVNEQMTVIRHRDSGTMILSDIQIVHREPITSENPHLSVQIGQTAFAYYDALSRAVKLDEHMRSGTLPASFRYPYQNEINLLQSNLDFKKLSRAYQVSVGKFLPPAISYSEYTFERMLGLFQHATEIRINWDNDDASMLHYIFGPFKSPMTLPVVRSAMNVATANPPTFVLNVKIHCLKQHSRRVFLCHLVDEMQTPYGRPLVMKLAWAPILEEYKKVFEFSRVVETPDIDDEFETLQYLADGDPEMNCRVPKPYGHFSGDVKILEQPYKFSAYFVEDCEGCYPIGIADEIDVDLSISISEWLESVHHRQLLVHNNLSRDNILFKPSDPTGFYVVGWQKASPIEDTGVVEVLECVEPEEELLQGLLASKKHHVYEKRGRQDLEDADEDEYSQIESISNEYEDA